MNTHFFVIPFAASGNRADIPETVQPDGSISFPDGYGPDYSLDPEVNPSAILIARTTFNGLMYDITSSLAALQADFPQWITSSDNGGTPYAYNKNAVVRYTDGELWSSLITANTATPGTDITKWILFGSQWATTMQLNAEIARAIAAEALLAPINNPIFTGSPQTPTKPPGTGGNVIASCSFVASAVAAETARAEAAEALLAPNNSPDFGGNPRWNGDTLATENYADASVAAERNRAISAEALLAPLLNPALEGTPTTPTPGGGDSSQQIPNTSWVQGVLSNLTIGTDKGTYQIGPLIIKWIVGPFDPADGSEPGYDLFYDSNFPNECFGAIASTDIAHGTNASDYWYQTCAGGGSWPLNGLGIQRQRPANGSFNGAPTRAIVYALGR